MAVQEWFWGQHPEVNGWVVVPRESTELEPGVLDAGSVTENYAGALMADVLDGDDVEPHLTVVDYMGGPGERVFIETEAQLRAVIAALEGRGDIVRHDDEAAAGLVSGVLAEGDVSVASQGMGCGTHDHDGACNLCWITDGSIGLVTNYCELPAGHDGSHVCVCGQETDPDTEAGSYFLGG